MELEIFGWRGYVCACWAPVGTPKASIMLVHGHGEHIARFDHVAAALTDKGYAMLGFDLRGHGKSGGSRGHTPSYDCADG